MRLKYIQRIISIRRITALLSLSALILLSLVSPLSAQTVTQGYSFEGVAQRGMVVALKAGDTTKIELANLDNAERVHGVVVDPNDAPVTISNDKEKVFVATVGRYDMLVSDQNGVIQQGDYITVSSLGGIAMKADNKHNFAVGKALGNFDGQTGVISKTQLKDNAGGVAEIRMGRISVDIGIGANPLAKPKTSNVPEFLRKAAEEIVDKPVASIRIYVGLIVLLTAGGIAGGLLYSGVKSAIISIGRNPLSKKSIFRGLIQVILTSILIFLIGIFGVYLLLKL